MSRNYYPIFLDLTSRLVLVVGGGEVAWRKVEGLLSAEARVRVVAPLICPELQLLRGPAELLLEPYEARHLDGAALVIAATDSPEVNARVADDCRGRGLFCNVVDVPEQCDFIVPSILRQGPLVIAVSTGGASPMAAAAIRRELETRFGPEYGRWLEALGRARCTIINQVPEAARRREIFQQLADADLLASARRGQAELDHRLAEILRRCGLKEFDS